MLVSTEIAKKHYLLLPDYLRHPSLCPDLMNFQVRPNLELMHFVYEEKEMFFLYSFISESNKNHNTRDFSSPFGYGGPISNVSDVNFLIRANSKFQEFALSEGFLAELIKYVPELNQHEFRKLRKFSPKEVVLISLDSNFNFRNFYSGNLRRELSKPLDFKIYESKSLEHIENFSNIYINRMSEKKSRKELQYDLGQIQKLINLEISQFYIFELRGKMCAGAIFIQDGIFSQYYLSASNVEGASVGALKHLIDYGLQQAARSGAQTCNLGGGVSDSKSDPLFFSKSRFAKTFVKLFVGVEIFDDKRYKLMSESAGIDTNKTDFNVFWYKDL